MAGFGLNLKLILYLQSPCLTENLGFLNPPLLQAAKRYLQIWKFSLRAWGTSIKFKFLASNLNHTEGQ